MITVKEFISKIEGYNNNKIVLLSLVAAIPLLIFSIYYASNDDMEVLFSGMAEKDVAKVTMALDEKKIPYKVDLSSSSINVSKDDVHNIRMSIMSDGVILDANVGFEIFNEAEFGMTEFSQQINYQRALQGELARTISSLEEIKYARVHIVQPKGRLFKSSSEKSSASIILFMKHGASISDEQVRGIQNIVSSSIENLDASMVTITSQSGIILSQGESNKVKVDAGKFTKREKLEKFYKEKVNKILSGSLESKKFTTSVNVEFDYTKSNIHEERYLSTPNSKVIKREKVSTAKKTGATTKDIEYEIGRRVENIEFETGRVKRISIGVLVPKDVTNSQAEKLKKVISMAIGINPDRGDSIALFADDFSLNINPPVKEFNDAPVINGENTSTTSKITENSNPLTESLLGLLGGNYFILLNIMIGVIVILFVFTMVSLLLRNTKRARLSLSEKDQIVQELSDWFAKGK